MSCRAHSCIPLDVQLGSVGAKWHSSALQTVFLIEDAIELQERDRPLEKNILFTVGFVRPVRSYLFWLWEDVGEIPE